MKKRIIKIIAWILIAAFAAQDVVWANPDFVQRSGTPSQGTLQIPSFFQNIDPARILEKNLISVLAYEYKPSTSTHLVLHDRGVRMELELPADSQGIIPCATIVGGKKVHYKARILPDKSIELLPGSADVNAEPVPAEPAPSEPAVAREIINGAAHIASPAEVRAEEPLVPKRDDFKQRAIKVMSATLVLGAILSILYLCGALEWYVEIKSGIPAGSLFFWKAAILDSITGMLMWSTSDIIGQYLNSGKDIKFKQSLILGGFGIFQGVGTHLLFNSIELLPVMSWAIGQMLLRTGVALTGGLAISLVFARATSMARRLLGVGEYSKKKEWRKTGDVLLVKFALAPIKTFIVINMLPRAVRVIAEQVWDYFMTVFSAYLMNRKDPFFTRRLVARFSGAGKISSGNDAGTAMLNGIAPFGRIYAALGIYSAALFASPFIEAAFVIPGALIYANSPMVMGVAMAIFTVLHILNIDRNVYARAPPAGKVKILFKTLFAPLTVSFLTVYLSVHYGFTGWELITQNIILHHSINLFALVTKRRLFHAAVIGGNDSIVRAGRATGKDIIYDKIMKLDGAKIQNDKDEHFMLSVSVDADAQNPKKTGKAVVKQNAAVIRILKNDDRNKEEIGLIRLIIRDDVATGGCILELTRASIKESDIIDETDKVILQRAFRLITPLLPYGSSKMSIPRMSDTDTLRAIGANTAWKNTRMCSMLSQCGWDAETVTLRDRATRIGHILYDGRAEQARTNTVEEFSYPAEVLSLLAERFNLHTPQADPVGAEILRDADVEIWLTRRKISSVNELRRTLIRETILAYSQSSAVIEYIEKLESIARSAKKNELSRGDTIKCAFIAGQIESALEEYSVSLAAMDDVVSVHLSSRVPPMTIDRVLQPWQRTYYHMAADPAKVSGIYKRFEKIMARISAKLPGRIIRDGSGKDIGHINRAEKYVPTTRITRAKFDLIVRRVRNDEKLVRIYEMGIMDRILEIQEQLEGRMGASAKKAGAGRNAEGILENILRLQETVTEQGPPNPGTMGISRKKEIQVQKTLSDIATAEEAYRMYSGRQLYLEMSLDGIKNSLKAAITFLGPYLNKGRLSKYNKNYLEGKLSLARRLSGKFSHVEGRAWRDAQTKSSEEGLGQISKSIKRIRERISRAFRGLASDKTGAMPVGSPRFIASLILGILVVGSIIFLVPNTYLLPKPVIVTLISVALWTGASHMGLMINYPLDDDWIRGNGPDEKLGGLLEQFKLELRKAFAQGDMQRALSMCNEAIALEPQSSALHCARGMVYARLRRYEEALADFDRALKYDPENANAYFCRGFLFVVEGRSEDGVKDLKKAIHFDSRCREEAIAILQEFGLSTDLDGGEALGAAASDWKGFASDGEQYTTEPAKDPVQKSLFARIFTATKKGTGYAILDVLLTSVGVVLVKSVLMSVLPPGHEMGPQAYGAARYLLSLAFYASIWIFIWQTGKSVYNKLRGINDIDGTGSGFFPEVKLWKTLNGSDKTLLVKGALYAHALGGLALYFSLGLLSATTAQFAFMTNFVFGCLLAWWKLKEKMTLRIIFGGITALAAIAARFIFWPDHSNTPQYEAKGVFWSIGIGAAIGAAFFFALRQITHKLFLTRHEKTPGLTMIKFNYALAAAALMIPTFLLQYFTTGAISNPLIADWRLYAGAAIIFPLAYLAVFNAQRTKGFDVGNFASVVTAVPAATFFVEWAVQNYLPDHPVQVLLMNLIVIIGVYFANRKSAGKGALPANAVSIEKPAGSYPVLRRALTILSIISGVAVVLWLVRKYDDLVLKWDFRKNDRMFKDATNYAADQKFSEDWRNAGKPPALGRDRLLSEQVEDVNELASNLTKLPPLMDPCAPRDDREKERVDRSIEIIRSLTKPVEAAFAIGMYNEEERLMPKSDHNPLGEDALRVKVAELQALTKINPNFRWRLILVDDGTAGAASKLCAQKLWDEILEEYSNKGQQLSRPQVTFKEITPEEKERIGSKKGAAVILGMREAVSLGCDYMGYTDLDISTNLMQTGLLLESLYHGKSGCAIGSRWTNQGVAKNTSLSSKISSKVYNLCVRVLLPPLRGIKDTQRGFKLFSNDAARKILPYATDNTFSFDTELLLLTKLAGYAIDEVPIAWYDSHEASKLNTLSQAPKMLNGVLKQRAHIRDNPFSKPDSVQGTARPKGAAPDIATGPTTSFDRTWSFEKETEKSAARDKAMLFEEELVDILSYISTDGQLPRIGRVCYELAYNLMFHGEGGQITVSYGPAASGGMKEIKVIASDRNASGMDDPNGLLRRSIEIHRKNRAIGEASLGGADFAIMDTPEQPEAQKEGFGMRNICLIPDVVAIETRGRKFVRSGPGISSPDNTLSDILGVEDRAKMVCIGGSDIVSGTRITATWLQEAPRRIAKEAEVMPEGPFVPGNPMGRRYLKQPPTRIDLMTERLMAWLARSGPGTDTKMLEARIRRYLQAISLRPSAELFFRLFLRPEIIVSVEDLDLDRRYSVAYIVVSRLDYYSVDLNDEKIRALIKNITPSREDLVLAAIFGLDPGKAVMPVDETELRKDPKSLLARYARGLIANIDKFKDERGLDRTFDLMLFYNNRVFAYINDPRSALRRIKSVAALICGSDKGFLEIFEKAIDDAFNQAETPQILLNRMLSVERFQRIGVPGAIINSDIKKVLDNLSMPAQALIGHNAKFIESLPISRYEARIKQDVDYQEWAREIFSLGDWANLFAHARAVQLSPQDTSILREDEKNDPFVYFYRRSDQKRRKELAHKIASLGEASLNEMAPFLNDIPSIVFERLNQGRVTGEAIPHVFEKYESFIAAYPRRIGLITNTRTASLLYRHGAKQFIREALKYRSEYYNEYKTQESLEARAEARSDAKEALSKFFLYNPSPELLKFAFRLWNKRLSPGAPDRKRALKGGLKAGEKIKLISDDELNVLNWAVNNIPKGSNTRDERRRLHNFILALVERRMQGEDDPVARFMGNTITHMDTTLEKKEERNNAVLEFIKFAMIYTGLPRYIQKNKNGALERYLKAMVGKSGKRFVLQAAQYKRLHDELTRLLMEDIFNNTATLSEEDKAVIKKSADEHSGAWLEDSFLISLARYYGFQNQAGQRAVEQYMLALARSNIRENTFRDLPRYDWADAGIRAWFGESLIKKMQAGYKKSFDLEGGIEGLRGLYRDIFNDILLHLNIHETAPDRMEEAVRAIFEQSGNGENFDAFWGIFISIKASLGAGDSISFDVVEKWKESLKALSPEKSFPLWSEFLINLEQMNAVQRHKQNLGRKADFIVTEDPVEFVRSAEKPYYTCQRIIEPTGMNNGGRPINRARQGQFILGQVKMDDIPQARSILEIARDENTGKKILLVERFYSSGVITTRAFQQQVIDWVIDNGEIDYIVFSGTQPPTNVSTSVKIALLPSDGDVYRDTKWPDSGLALDVAKYKREHGIELPPMDNIRTAAGASSSGMRVSSKSKRVAKPAAPPAAPENRGSALLSDTTGTVSAQIAKPIEALPKRPNESGDQRGRRYLKQPPLQPDRSSQVRNIDKDRLRLFKSIMAEYAIQTLRYGVPDRAKATKHVSEKFDKLSEVLSCDDPGDRTSFAELGSDYADAAFFAAAILGYREVVIFETDRRICGDLAKLRERLINNRLLKDGQVKIEMSDYARQGLSGYKVIYHAKDHDIGEGLLDDMNNDTIPCGTIFVVYQKQEVWPESDRFAPLDKLLNFGWKRFKTQHKEFMVMEKMLMAEEAELLKAGWPIDPHGIVQKKLQFVLMKRVEVTFKRLTGMAAERKGVWPIARVAAALITNNMDSKADNIASQEEYTAMNGVGIYAYAEMRLVFEVLRSCVTRVRETDRENYIYLLNSLERKSLAAKFDTRDIEGLCRLNSSAGHPFEERLVCITSMPCKYCLNILAILGAKQIVYGYNIDRVDHEEKARTHAFKLHAAKLKLQTAKLPLDTEDGDPNDLFFAMHKKPDFDTLQQLINELYSEALNRGPDAAQVFEAELDELLAGVGVNADTAPAELIIKVQDKFILQVPLAQVPVPTVTNTTGIASGALISLYEATYFHHDLMGVLMPIINIVDMVDRQEQDDKSLIRKMGQAIYDVKNASKAMILTEGDAAEKTINFKNSAKRLIGLFTANNVDLLMEQTRTIWGNRYHLNADNEVRIFKCQVAIMLSILQGIAQDAPDRSEDVDVKEVVSIIAGAINLENTVVLEIGMGASSARGNSSELLRILFNLLRNAGRAVKRKPGSVAIKTCAEGDRIIIKVSDSGPGMAVNEVNSFNGSRSVASTQEGFGHGVGLTVVRELTERNGGTVVLESEPGKGSVFTIKLPIGKATASTEPDTTRTTTSTNGASQLPRYGDNGTGPALPGTQPGNELGRHHFKPTPDEQVRFVKATGTSTAAEAVSGSDLKKLPGYSIENMLLNNERIVFGEALKYLDFSRNVPSDQLSRRGIFCLALIKAVRNTKKDPVALKRLIFELAVLLISEKSWFDYPFISISYEVHHYDDYKDVMAVCGLALVIANRFEPHNFVYPRTIENISSGYNDRDRNAIRLIGFFREEKYALPLIRRLANELDQKYDADPWHIDLNMAILDALEAINYESSEVRQEVLEALQGLGRRIKTRQTNIVKKRVEAVVKVLQAGEKPTNCLQNYERLTEEFNIFIRTHNVKQMKLLHALYGFKHYIPFLDRGGYEELGLRVGLYDPVDEAYGESYRTILREKLELVRIDYDSMLAKLRTGSSAARPAVTETTGTISEKTGTSQLPRYGDNGTGPALPNEGRGAMHLRPTDKDPDAKRAQRYRDRMRSASKTKEKASAAMPAPFNGMARDEIIAYLKELGDKVWAYKARTPHNVAACSKGKFSGLDVILALIDNNISLSEAGLVWGRFMSKDELKDAVSALKTRLEKSDLEDKRPTAANLGRIGNGIITAGRLNQTKLIFLMTWEEAGMVGEVRLTRKEGRKILMGYVRDYYKKVPDAKEPPSVVDLASVHGLDTTTIYAFLKRSGLSYEELGIRRERSPTTNMKRKRRSPEEWVELVKELRARLAEKFNTEYLVYPTTATNLAMVAEPSEDVTSKVLSEAKAKHKAMLGALISQRASSEPHVVLSKFNDKIHAILQEMIRSPEDVLPEKIQELAVFVKLSPGTVKKLFASLLRNRFFKAEVILERGERRWDFIRRVLQTYVDLVHNNEVKINAPSPVAERSPGVLTGITSVTYQELMRLSGYRGARGTSLPVNVGFGARFADGSIRGEPEPDRFKKKNKPVSISRDLIKMTEQLFRYEFILARIGNDEIVCDENNPVILKVETSEPIASRQDWFLMKVCKEGSGYYAVVIDEQGREIDERRYFKHGIDFGKDEATSLLTVDAEESGSPVKTSVKAGPGVALRHFYIYPNPDEGSTIIVYRTNGSAVIYRRCVDPLKIAKYIRSGQAEKVNHGKIAQNDLKNMTQEVVYDVYKILDLGYAIAGQDGTLLKRVGLGSYGNLYASVDQAVASVETFFGNAEKKYAAIKGIISACMSRKKLNMLFVCTSNIIRSPTMHLVAEDFIEEHSLSRTVKVSSAGTYEWGVRDLRANFDKNKILLDHLREKGINSKLLKRFKSNPDGLSGDSVDKADIIIVAGEAHRAAIVKRFPKASDKIFLLNETLPVANSLYGQDVPDGIESFDEINVGMRDHLLPLLLKPKESEDNGVPRATKSYLDRGTGPALPGEPPFAHHFKPTPEEFDKLKVTQAENNGAGAGLPAEPSRNADIQKIVEMAKKERCIAVLGLPGIGKTAALKTIPDVIYVAMRPKSWFDKTPDLTQGNDLLERIEAKNGGKSSFEGRIIVLDEIFLGKGSPIKKVVSQLLKRNAVVIMLGTCWDENSFKRLLRSIDRENSIYRMRPAAFDEFADILMATRRNFAELSGAEKINLYSLSGGNIRYAGTLLEDRESGRIKDLSPASNGQIIRSSLHGIAISYYEGIGDPFGIMDEKMEYIKFLERFYNPVKVSDIDKFSDHDRQTIGNYIEYGLLVVKDDTISINGLILRAMSEPEEIEPATASAAAETQPTVPNSTGTVSSETGTSQSPRYGDNGTGPALPGDQPGNELGRRYFKPIPDDQHAQPGKSNQVRDGEVLAAVPSAKAVARPYLQTLMRESTALHSACNDISAIMKGVAIKFSCKTLGKEYIFDPSALMINFIYGVPLMKDVETDVMVEGQFDIDVLQKAASLLADIVSDKQFDGGAGYEERQRRIQEIAELVKAQTGAKSGMNSGTVSETNAQVNIGGDTAKVGTAQSEKTVTPATAEEIMSHLAGFESSGHKLLAIGKMVDVLGIGGNDAVLHVGAGSIAFHDIACAVKGAKVDVVQPRFDHDFDQHDSYGWFLDCYRLILNGDFKVDLIGNRIDFETYGDYLENVNLPREHYSYAFLFDCLESVGGFDYHNREKEPFIKEVLHSLRDEATILISVYAGRIKPLVDLVKSCGTECGYEINEGRTFEIGRNSGGEVLELQVRRRKSTEPEKPATPSVMAAQSTAAVGSQEPIEYLMNIVNPEELSQNMIEGILSALFSNKKPTFAFSRKLKGLESKHVLALVDQLRKWKEATANSNPKMKKLLDNFTVLTYDDLAAELSARGIDANDKYGLIFTYEPKSEIGTERQGSAIRRVCITEPENGFPADYYYPLLEMVTVSVAKELLGWDETELKDAMAKSGITADVFGIEPSIDDKTGILIFNVLPKMELYDNNSRVSRYTRLLQFLHSA